MLLENREPQEELRQLFLIYVQGGKAGFARLPDVGSSVNVGEVGFTLEPFATSTERLVEALAESLTETGLFRDEALAMARTWQHGYFQDEGLRVLYVLPQAFVDRELPLDVQPREVADAERGRVPGAPVDSLVRTFVARLDLLTPSREAELLSVVEGYGLGLPAQRRAAAARLESWGRFALPYLNRVRSLSDDPELLAVLEETLDRLRAVR